MRIVAVCVRERESRDNSYYNVRIFFELGDGFGGGDLFWVGVVLGQDHIA